MEIIILVPALLTSIWIARQSCAKAFLDIYLPVALCIPAWPRLVLAGLPDPTFQEAAILPISAVFFYKWRKLYRFSQFDLLVAAFVFIQGLSEYLNTGYANAQNLMFDVMFNGLLPYLLAKSFLQTFQARTLFLRRFVWCVCIVILISLYEFKFSYNPFKGVFDSLFPDEGDVWVTTFRYGFARVAGPYGHAILAGLIFMFAIRLQSWLRRAKLWEPTFRRFHPGALSKARILEAVTVVGLLLTWVRGPQFGALIGWLISVASRGRDPKRGLKNCLIGLVAVGLPLAIWGYSYASIGRSEARTAAQESAAYRKELLDGYVQIVKQHLWIGWGRNTWPKYPSMPSIDNYYLLIALMHGIISLAFLLAILIVMSVRLYRNGVRTRLSDRLSSALSFDLLGIYIGFMFSIATVYVGESVFPVFFMLLGSSEALLVHCRRGRMERRPKEQKGLAEVRPFRFQRVLT